MHENYIHEIPAHDGRENKKCVWYVFDCELNPAKQNVR